MAAQEPVAGVGQTVEEGRAAHRVIARDQRDLGPQRIGLQFEVLGIAARRDFGPHVLRGLDLFDRSAPFPCPAHTGGHQQALTSVMIGDLVGNQFKVSIKDMQSRSRKKGITFPRQVAMYLSRKYTDESLADIGRNFNRDHSTVLHAIKVVTNLTNRDTSVNAQLSLLSDKVKQL